MDILFQIGLFIILYILKMIIILVVVSFILRFSPYCIDRIIYIPLTIPIIYRDHAKTRRGLIKDIGFEIFVYFIVFLVSFGLLELLIRILESVYLTFFMLFITFLIEIFSIIVRMISFVSRIIFSPQRFNERIFVEEIVGENMKTRYNTDPWTTHESLKIFREISVGPIIVSLIYYYYNLSMTIIDGIALIRRKISDFLKKFGSIGLLIPVLVVFLLFVPTIPKSGEYVPRDPPAPQNPDFIGKTIAEVIGLEIVLVIFFSVLILTVYLPIIDYLGPDITFGVEKQFNSHNGQCFCQERKKHYQKRIRPVLLQIESWDNFQKQLEVD